MASIKSSLTYVTFDFDRTIDFVNDSGHENKGVNTPSSEQDKSMDHSL